MICVAWIVREDGEGKVSNIKVFSRLHLKNGHCFCVHVHHHRILVGVLLY